MTLLLKNQTADELYRQLAHLGVKPRLARLLQVAAVRRSEFPPLAPGVSPRVLAEVRQHTAIPNLSLVEKVVSPQDGFAKYLFRGDGPEPFEAVRIPLLHRPQDRKYVVCVSSQVGCALGCAVLCHGPDGFPPPVGYLGNRRPGGQDPGRLGAPGPRCGVHGHGRTAAQL